MPIANVLDPTGRLAPPEGFQGSVDFQGYELVSTPGQPPRFAAKNAVDDTARWDPQFGQTAGCDGTIYAAATFPDGRIALGGDFTTCGNVAVARVAIWNPATGVFQALGSGAANGVGVGSVFALAIAGSDVYVGGSFTQAGGGAANYVARFQSTTQTWTSLGSGASNGVDNVVSALAIAGSDVYVGGIFTLAGGGVANSVARFNTSTQAWASLGSGAANGVSCCVNALAISGSDLYVGGGFNQAGGAAANRVARFNTTTQSWASLGIGAANGVDSTVRALAVAGSDVYVGGNFGQAGGAVANHVARFNIASQSWASLGNGAANGVSNSAHTLGISGSDVYVGGFFDQAGGAVANGVARFDSAGQTWASLGHGAANGVNSVVHALAFVSSDVYVGGGFDQAGGATANFLARFNSATETWASIGTWANGVAGFEVRALAIAGSDVYIGGVFTEVGGVPANNVARFNTITRTWASLGSGAANGVNGEVRALAVSGSEVFVAGFFTQAGGAVANRVARFNTTTQTWASLGNGAANGVSDLVYTLAIAGSNVYVGGSFTLAGGAAANRVARFDTATQNWASLGSGAADGLDGSVYALAIAGSDVYVGGGFDQAGGTAAFSLARFNITTQTWASLGSGPANGVAGAVLALVIADTDVYVGGDFFQAGGAVSNRVARFSTTSQTWASLGNGAANGVSGEVRALAVGGNDVHVGGSFTQAGGSAANRVARFNTTSQTWASFGSGAANGANGGVNVLAVACTDAAGSPSPCTPSARSRDLYLGGFFSSAGPNVSQRIARYDIRRSTTSSIAASPGSSVTANTPITFTASVATTNFPPPPGTPGTVAFFDNAAVIAACASQSVVGGADTRSATCATSALRVGTHDVIARYQGDVLNFIGTSDPLAMTVTAPALDLSPTTLPGAWRGISYSQTIGMTGSGSVAPITYTQTAGSLPNGLTLLSNGQLSGIPNTEGTFTFTITGTDSSTTSASGGAFSVSREYSVTTSLQSTTVTIGTINPSPSLVGQAYTVSVTVSAAQSTPNGVVSCSDGTGASDTKALSGGQATCSLTSSSAGDKTISVVYGVQGSYDASVQTAPHTVQNANEAPTLGYAPAPGESVSLTGAGTQLGSLANGSVGITASGGRGTGSVTLGCNVSGGNFTLQGAPSGPTGVGASPAPISVQCTRTAAVQNGTLSCTETASPGGAQQGRSWPLVCPGADAVPPTVTYSPLPTNTVTFPDGAVNQVVQAGIQVSSSGAVGSGSTTIACDLQGANPTAFQIQSGNNQLVNALQGGVNLQLGCTLGNSLRSASLVCTETDSPVTATRGRSWPLSCPPGIATASGTVSVGARNAVRGAKVGIPISFRGEGQTRDFRAEVSFNKTQLSVLQVTPVGGATCARRAAPNDDRIEVQRSTAGPLLAEDTRYCEVTFQVASNAPGGALPLTVVASTCTDTGGTSRLCTAQSGRVAVAALDPAPAEGAAIVIAGHEGTVSQTRTLRVVNRGATPQQVTDCRLQPATGLSIAAPTTYPLVMAPQTTGQVVIACVLPPLNQPRFATLECDSSDAMRSVMRYALTCMTLPAGTPLPAEQVLDIEQRAGEQMGSSAARSANGGTQNKGLGGGVVTFLGAPLGGSDGNGRVAVFVDQGSPVAKARGDWTAGGLREVGSLSAPRTEKASVTGTERLGQAIALRADGLQLAVGAPQGGPSGPTGPGRVYLFARPPGGWESFDSRVDLPTVLEAPTLPGGAAAEFGAALAYSEGGDLLVGAPGSSVGVSGAGAVFAYPANGSGFDSPISITSAQGIGNGRFGTAIAVGEGDVLVGAPGEFSASLKTGAVYRLTLQGGVPGAPVRLTPATPLAANDQYGAAVLTASSLWLVGAPGADSVQGTDSGTVFVFRAGPSPTQLSRWLPHSGNAQGLGASLVATDRKVFAGAPLADTTGTDAGRVYAFTIKSSYAATETPSAALDNANAQAGDEFGRALAVSYGQAVIGVPKADVVLPDTTTLNDVGRADPFLLIELFGSGFE